MYGGGDFPCQDFRSRASVSETNTTICYPGTESTSRTVIQRVLKTNIVLVDSSSKFSSWLTALAGEKHFYKSRIGATLTRCPMREPQLQGVHPAHSCHLMYDIREQRICKSKAVGCCGPCLVCGKAASLYLSIKAGFLLSILDSSHQNIIGKLTHLLILSSHCMLRF